MDKQDGPSMEDAQAFYSVLVQEQVLVNLSRETGMGLGNVAHWIRAGMLGVSPQMVAQAEEQVTAWLRGMNEKRRQARGSG